MRVAHAASPRQAVTINSKLDGDEQQRAVGQARGDDL
jgi:hypothetical protein